MNKSSKYLIVIGGPTASGKTSLAIRLAKTYDCSIISADSRQVYKELNIGTAKPSQEELDAAPHFLINHISIQDDYNVGQYEEDALEVLSNLYEKNNVAIVVGGSGLYIKSLLEGLDNFPNVSKEITEHYNAIFNKNGILPLQIELKKNDPAYAKIVDLDNPHRLIRALSVISISGKAFSDFLNKKKVSRSFQPILIALDHPREKLYDRINLRVDRMIKDGLVKEVQSLQSFRELNSLNTVGYKEILKYLDGEWTLNQAVEKIKQHSRNYAKRQITWFNNQQDFEQFNPNQIYNIEKYINRQMNKVDLIKKNNR